MNVLNKTAICFPLLLGSMLSIAVVGLTGPNGWKNKPLNEFQIKSSIVSASLIGTLVIVTTL